MFYRYLVREANGKETACVYMIQVIHIIDNSIEDVQVFDPAGNNITEMFID